LKILDKIVLKVDKAVMKKVFFFFISKSNSAKFCRTCASYIEKSKIPRVALSYGLDFPLVKPEISKLNRIEGRLLAPRYVFQSVWTFQGPNGQFKAKGGIVNVPVEIDTNDKALPRELTQSEKTMDHMGSHDASFMGVP